MKNGMKIGRISGLSLGIFFLFQTLAGMSVSRAQDVVIIANKDVPVSALSRSEIRSIFLGEKVRWENGRKITFVILKTDSHEDFLRTYVGNTPAQYRNYWKKMIFTGKSKAPKSFKTEEKVLEHVAETSGALGYVPPDALNDKVKAISIK